MNYVITELHWDAQQSSFVQVTRSATTQEAAAFDALKQAPQPFPEAISPRQFRQALTHFDYRTNVENAVAASDQDTKDWYAYATQFERHHPKVLSMAQQLGYTSDQIDAVWTYGASL
jgi:hypothetical protein